jgi:arginyl-tRNA--protein-N-Asp/Glu arginylyltransferase
MYRVVWDQLEACPYREGQTARLPLRLPPRLLTPEQLDIALEQGDRRSGRMLYRPTCPSCHACQAIRVPVARFVPSTSQRRVLRKNGESIEMELGPPELSRDRLELYNRHKQERNLARSEEPLSAVNYRAWLVDSCVDTREVRYRVDGRLIGISILDVGRTSVSSVYHYFDPDESPRSLGVHSVIKEIEWCASLGLEWYYLGLYVEDCSHLSYKASYWPHQRRVDGVWTEFTRP